MFRPLCLFTVLFWLSMPTPSFAASAGYWYNFKKYWTDFLGAQNGVVMTVMVVGAIGVTIIMFGGRWKR